MEGDGELREALLEAVEELERFLDASLHVDNKYDASNEIRCIWKNWDSITKVYAQQPSTRQFLLENFEGLCSMVKRFVDSVHHGRNYNIQKFFQLFKTMNRMAKFDPGCEKGFGNLMRNINLRLTQKGLEVVYHDFYDECDFGDDQGEELTEPQYLQNLVYDFVQSTFNALTEEKVKGMTLVVSSDGRYFSKDAIQIIIKMAAHNGVRRILVGQNGLLSSPAASAVVRKTVDVNKTKAVGAFLLTACHSRGGRSEDFGIKYMEYGGPVPKKIAKEIYHQWSTNVYHGLMTDIPVVDLSIRGTNNIFKSPQPFDVIVGDPTKIYVEKMKLIFDFPAIQKLLSCPKFTFCFDGLHGVSGIYAWRIFVEELGADSASLLNCESMEDFGGGHPDPNLTYATELVERMGLGKSSSEKEPPEFGAAVDSDADRNMVLGKRFFVTPSDSLAVVVANAAGCIPYFSGGVKRVVRSMPTSAALDVVAKRLGLNLHEVPTGWKYFCNLMDDTKRTICGDESFGIGSDHVREKDGIWAVLAWLSILAHKNKDNLSSGKLITVEDIVREHWKTYGRHYYTRYDYEDVDAFAAKELMAHMVKLHSDLSEVNRIVNETHPDVSEVVRGDEFEYKDVDGSVVKNQGIRYFFKDGSRLVFRLAGISSEGPRLLSRNLLTGKTSSEGASVIFRYSKTVAQGGTSPRRATVHFYIEQYDPSDTSKDSQEALAPLVDVALKLSKMHYFTGRSAPTLII